MIEKADGVTCPICFGEYTSSGDHRIASLKCGHLFGHSCILEWYGKRKNVLCPICSVKSSKSHLRLIYSSKVVALNTEKEHKLVEQYLNEFNAKNKLLEEIAILKTELEVLKLNKKCDCKCLSRKKDVMHDLLLCKKILVNYSTKYSLIIIDDVNNLIILSTQKDGKPAVLKFYDSGITAYKIFNENTHISHMKYMDGNIIVCINDKFFIINTYNFNIIFEDCNFNRITSILISPSNRNKLIIGDNKGNITLYLLGIAKRSINISNVPIHSICEFGEYLYVGTVFNIYKLKIETNWEEFLNEEESPEIFILNLNMNEMTCINIFGDDNNLLFVYRNKLNKILHYCIDTKEEKAINLGFKQIAKFNEFICDRHFYFVDQCNNKILVLNEKFEKRYEYKVDENLVSFDVKPGMLVILSEKFIYMYK